MIFDHRRFSCGTGNATFRSQPARTTPNIEPAGTTVATIGPNSASVKERVWGGQRVATGAEGTGNRRAILQRCGAWRSRVWGACRLPGRMGVGAEHKILLALLHLFPLCVTKRRDGDECISRK